MPPSRTDPRHDSRRQRLAEFVAWTRDHITGDEKGQAQIFLDRLFQAFGRPGLLEVGGTPEFRVRKSREDGGGTAFADYVWKPLLLIEMKKRGEALTRHYRQAFYYWTRLVPGRPRWVVLCNFDQFWIYDFENLLDDPVSKLSLDELPEHWGALAFIFPTNETPKFRIDRIKVTREAADKLAECYRRLEARRNVGRELGQRFILQMLIALFSEDIGLLPKYFVTELLDECSDPPKSFDLLGGRFAPKPLPTLDSIAHEPQYTVVRVCRSGRAIG